jgi:hypothetical protein
MNAITQSMQQNEQRSMLIRHKKGNPEGLHTGEQAPVSGIRVASSPY